MRMRPEAIRSFTVSEGIWRSCSVSAARSFSTGTSSDARRSRSSLIAVVGSVTPFMSQAMIWARPMSENPLRVFDGILKRLRLEGATAGPLVGTTFVAKDLYDVRGYRTGAGNPDWERTHEPAARTAPAIERLLAAGATLVGKSCTDELAFSLDGINVHYGTPLNPRFPDRLPGGSSSGSASAVAAGLCDFALGSDTSGSIRVPASYCGVYGFRPSHGAVPIDGVVPLAPAFDTVGWLARDAAMLRRSGRILLGRDDGPAAPGFT